MCSEPSGTDRDDPAGTIDRLIATALSTGAEAIHFRPTAKGLDIEFRQFGGLRPVEHLPVEAIRPFIDRIKAMSCLDLQERRLPQDGRIRLMRDGRTVDLRLAVLPVRFGEKAVLHVLEDEVVPPSPRDLGMPDRVAEIVMTALAGCTGLILFVGPGRSGLSTTLSSLASFLAAHGQEVLYVGHSLRADHGRVSQVSPRPDLGLTPAACIRSILRGDADGIVVDGIRSSETAAAVLEGARRGRLIIASLPSRNVGAALMDLLHLGVSGHDLAAHLRLVVAQRLAPSLCPSCRKEGAAPSSDLHGPALLRAVGGGLRPSSFFEASGCDRCGGSGRAGWLPFFEVLAIEEELVRVLETGPCPDGLRSSLYGNGRQRMRNDMVRAARRGDIDGATLLRLLASNPSGDGSF